MRVLLDTSAYSAFLRGHQDIVDVVQQADTVALNAVVLGELLAGFAKGKQSKKNRQHLDRFLQSRRVRVLRLDQATALCYSKILTFLRQEGTPVPTNDIWIASNAMEFGFQLVTTDSHFGKIPQVIVQLYRPT